MQSRMNLFNLAGKSAVITGGNGGIGLAFARGLMKSGCHVAIWARDKSKNEQAVAELKNLSNAKVFAFSCDVSSETAIQEAMDKTISAFGNVDVCFANAGIGQGMAIPEMTVEAWDEVMAVNARGIAMITVT